LVGGTIPGLVVIILTIIVTGSTLGLSNILPGAAIGGLLGCIVGFYSPRIGGSLFDVFTYFFASQS
jgi:hypothetical protein